MYKLLRWFLFKMDAEKAHHFTLQSLRLLVKIPFFKWLLRKLYAVEDKRLERRLF
ncbi:MAG: hypothetical protein U0T77_08285 [Chitinophagales bacterium]